MAVQLRHATVLVSEHAVTGKGTLLFPEEDSAVLFAEGVPVGSFGSFGELTLVMGVFALITESALGCVDPELADLSLPIAVLVGDKSGAERVVALGGWIRLGALGLVRLSLCLSLLVPAGGAV